MKIQLFHDSNEILIYSEFVHESNVFFTQNDKLMLDRYNELTYFFLILNEILIIDNEQTDSYIIHKDR